MIGAVMAGDRLTPHEQAAVQAALREGRVTRIERRQKRVEPLPPLDLSTPIERPKPEPYTLPAEMSVRQALEWAFGSEKARLDVDAIGATSGGQRPGRGAEAVLIERAHLGGVRIDTSPGTSDPAEEAEVIASIVRESLAWRDAVWVAELARTAQRPDYMSDARPRLVPLDWVWGRGVCRGRTGDAAKLGGQGWPHQPRLKRNRVLVYDPVLFTPCTWAPTAQQIARARRSYLEWWGHLLTIRQALRATRLRRFEVNTAMPPMEPWRTRD